jgi:hypothetical protein
MNFGPARIEMIMASKPAARTRSIS